MPRCPSGAVGPIAGKVLAGFAAGCCGAAPRLSAGAAPPPPPPPRFPRSSPVLDRPGTYTKFLSTVYVPLLVVVVGMYTNPVPGLNDIGDQLCPPPAPG